MNAIAYLDGKLAVAQQEARGSSPPRLQSDFCILNQNVQSVDILLHEAKHVNMLANDLVGGLGARVVLALHLERVGGGRQQRNMYVQVVCLLDAADDLFVCWGVQDLCKLHPHHDTMYMPCTRKPQHNTNDTPATTC